MKVRKAVIPVAGFGTRMLPASRSVPKVNFPVLDTPAIHYAVAEAAEAGIEHVVFVVSQGQDAVRAYFDRIPELEKALEQRGEEAMLRRMLAVSNMADLSYVLQRQQLGLGHAVLTARAMVGDEPFAVFLPDDVIWSDTPTIGQMMEIFDEFESTVIGVKEVPDEMVPSLGIVDARPIDDRISEVLGLVEKPSLAEAPSNLAVIGRYVLTPQVFDELERMPPGAKGEIQLTDALANMLSTQKVYAYRFPGVHFDVGTPLGLLKASVYAALHREGLADELREWLAGVLRSPAEGPAQST
jgi:UTP--glucose-1-phosphate uridylyltransferase